MALTLTSCYKSKIAANTPDCIIEQVKTLRKSDCGPSHVKSYQYENELVYAVYTYGCNMQMTTTIYDADCHYMGYFALNGGENISRDDFKAATFIRTIWETVP